MQPRTVVKIIGLSFAILCSTAQAVEHNIPAPFRGDTPNSTFSINYNDLDELLNASVLAMGKSNRTLAKDSTASIGTRLKTKVNRLTALEGNRFYFEAFKEKQPKKMLHQIRESLEQLPLEAPLKLFSKDEQLAYWLNLYNVTMLDELVSIYPKHSIKHQLTGPDSLLEKKILNVANTPLSLNDIQYTILGEKFNHDPLIIYGLYQGNIGGPNIRKHAYTADNVYKALRANANDFINSNRGTYARKGEEFRVSNLYLRNKQYFPSFNKDLKAHLLTYAEGYTRRELEDANRLKANITDWNITDLYGQTRSFGGAVNSNSAALSDAVVKSSIASGANMGVIDINLMANSSLRYTASFGRFSAEQAAMLREIRDQHAQHQGHVLVTDLPSQAEAKAKEPDQE